MSETAREQWRRENRKRFGRWALDAADDLRATGRVPGVTRFLQRNWPRLLGVGAAVALVATGAAPLSSALSIAQRVGFSMDALISIMGVLLPTGVIIGLIEKARNAGTLVFEKLPGPARVIIAVVVAGLFSITAGALGLEFDLSSIPEPLVMSAMAGLAYNLAKPLLKRARLTGGEPAPRASGREVN